MKIWFLILFGFTDDVPVRLQPPVPQMHYRSVPEIF